MGKIYSYLLDRPVSLDIILKFYSLPPSQKSSEQTWNPLPTTLMLQGVPEQESQAKQDQPERSCQFYSGRCIYYREKSFPLIRALTARLVEPRGKYDVLFSAVIEKKKHSGEKIFWGCAKEIGALWSRI